MKVPDHIIEAIRQGNELKFYKTYAWRSKVRPGVLARDRWECADCKKRGHVRKGEHVHHIKELKKFPALGYQMDNLITLCKQCHNARHPEKGFGNRCKKPGQWVPERW